jgi:hypothetical protein
MPAGTVTTTANDGGLGTLPSSTAKAHVIAGVCTGGTAGVLYPFSTQKSLTDTLVGGPAVQAAAYELAFDGGPIYVCPINASVAGVASAVTVVRAASSTGTITVAAGTPLDCYSVKIRVSSTGTGQLVTTGLVQVQVSVDGGTTYGAAQFVPNTGTFILRDQRSVATGLTLSFTVATTTFDYGDVHSFTCQAPFYSASDVTTMFTGLFADTTDWAWIHLVGYPTAGSSSANATASAVIASTVATNMATAYAAGQYVFAIMEAPPSTDAYLTTAFLNFTDRRVKIECGTDVLTSPLDGNSYTRSHAWPLSARLGMIRPSISPGQTGDGGIPDAPGGPLQGVVSINRDERTAGASMYDQGFGVSMTYQGFPGFFCDAGRMKAPAGSDYTLVMYRRVMDQACKYARIAGFKYLNSPLAVDSTTGHLLAATAAGIKSYVDKYVRAAMGTEFSDLIITVNDTDNLLTVQKLKIKVQVIGFAYALNVEEEIEFYNPALTLV